MGNHIHTFEYGSGTLEKTTYRCSCGLEHIMGNITAPTPKVMSKDTLQEDVRQLLLDLLQQYDDSEKPMNVELLRMFIENTEVNILTIISKECDRAEKKGYKKGYIAGGIAVAVSFRDHTTNKQINEFKSKLLVATDNRIAQLSAQPKKEGI